MKNSHIWSPYDLDEAAAAHLFFLVLEIEVLSKSDLILPTFQGRITHMYEGIRVTIIFLVDYLIGLFGDKCQKSISPVSQRPAILNCHILC